MSDKKSAILPLTVVARMRARPGTGPALRTALDMLVTATLTEEGCVSYELHQSQDDEDVFVMYEIWASRSHHDVHSTSPHLRAFAQASADLLDGGILIDRLTPLKPGNES